VGAILTQKNVDIKSVEEYKKLEEDLKKYGLSMESPRSLVSVLKTITETGRDPKKILSELAHLKSLRQAERRLKNNCKIWESRAARYKEIIPLCEQLVLFGIGFPEMAALHAAIIKKADLENLPYGEAAYALMKGIDTSEKVSDAKKQLIHAQKQLYETVMQINMVKQILARQNDAVIALAKLQFYGVKEDQILKTCRSIEANGLYNMNGAPTMNSHQFSVF